MMEMDTGFPRDFEIINGRHVVKKHVATIHCSNKLSLLERKISNAFCPEKEIEFNPLVDWVKYLIFPIRNNLEVKRDKKFGGNITYNSFEKFEKDYSAGKVHPLDLKNAAAEALIEILEPARKHFSKGKPKKMLEELNDLIITR